MESNITRLMAMIDDKAGRTAREEEQRVNELIRKRDELLNAVKELKPRITDLITLGNYALEHGIRIEAKDFRDECYDKGHFITNGWSHILGFVHKNNDIIREIGAIMGGACGLWDFMTDGDKVYEIHEETKEKRTPTIKALERFFEQFPTFESEFYKHIEKMCK